MFKKIIKLIVDHLPGSELRRCIYVSCNSTECIRHLNHWGRHEDAWRYKWRGYYG